MKATVKLILLFGVCIVFFISCEDEVLHGDAWHSVSGTIYDSLTNNPIDSALLKINYSTSITYDITDSTGEYSVPGIGIITLIVIKDGYSSKQAELNVVTDTTGVDFYLVK